MAEIDETLYEVIGIVSDITAVTEENSSSASCLCFKNLEKQRIAERLRTTDKTDNYALQDNTKETHVICVGRAYILYSL